MTRRTQPRLFRASEFSTPKEWLYFAVEFDLELCSSCRRSARRSPAPPRDPSWTCGACSKSAHLPVHPDLWTAITTRRNVETDCPICRESVAIRDCWISDDAQRVFCASHAKSVRAEDRFEMARQSLERDARSPIREIPPVERQKTASFYRRAELPREKSVRPSGSASHRKYSSSSSELRSEPPPCSDFAQG